MKLFLDDERFPPGTGEGWTIVRTVPEAIAAMMERGCAEFISFDHDLGPDLETGYDLAHWLVERDLDNHGVFIPANFTFYVHSQNPVGAKNIQSLLDRYLEQKA